MLSKILEKHCMQQCWLLFSEAQNEKKWDDTKINHFDDNDPDSDILCVDGTDSDPVFTLSGGEVILCKMIHLRPVFGVIVYYGTSTWWGNETCEGHRGENKMKNRKFKNGKDKTRLVTGDISL